MGGKLKRDRIWEKHKNIEMLFVILLLEKIRVLKILWKDQKWRHLLFFLATNYIQPLPCQRCLCHDIQATTWTKQKIPLDPDVDNGLHHCSLLRRVKHLLPLRPDKIWLGGWGVQQLPKHHLCCRNCRQVFYILVNFINIWDWFFCSKRIRSFLANRCTNLPNLIGTQCTI